METVTIHSIQGEAALQQALEFVGAITVEKFKSTPPPPPQFFFGAYCDGKIVGTIGLDFGSDQTPFPLEEHWQLDKTKTPLPFRREEIVEIGRWMAVRPGVSLSLFYVAIIFSLAQGKHYCIAQMKPKIAQHSTQIGFIMLPVAGVTLIPGVIPESARPYYLEDPPSLYMLRVEQMHQAIRLVLPQLHTMSLDFLLEERGSK